MQRFLPLATIALLAACADRPAAAPLVPEAPALAEAEPLTHADGDRTLLVSEQTVDPPQLYVDLTAPFADAPVPGGPEVKPEPPTPTEEPALAGLTGEFSYRGGRSSMQRSVDHVVDEMSAFVRPIARKRLTAANKIPKRIAIAQDGDEVTVRIDGRTYAATLDGPSKRVQGADGKPSRLRYRLRDGALYQSFDAAEGDRTNVFTRRDDGGIDMAVRITSDRLPADVRYRLSFEPAD